MAPALKVVIRLTRWEGGGHTVFAIPDYVFGIFPGMILICTPAIGHQLHQDQCHSPAPSPDNP